MILMVKGAWDYRQFIFTNIRAELQGQYSKSRFGLLWLFLNPLAQASVLALVLSQLLGARMSGIEGEYAYAVYLLSGILGWQLFSELTSNFATMFTQRANLIKKSSFPKVCIPLIVMGSAIVQHIIFSFIVIGVVWWLGVSPSWALINVFLGIALTVGLATSIGIVIGTLDVFSRDVRNFWQIVLQFWFWLTPIVYSKDILPAKFKFLLEFNPMYWILEIYQNAIARKNLYFTSELLWLFCFEVIALMFAFFLFIKASSDIVDEI